MFSRKYQLTIQEFAAADGRGIVRPLITSISPETYQFLHPIVLISYHLT
jgi:hypothetical protein